MKKIYNKPTTHSVRTEMESLLTPPSQLDHADSKPFSPLDGWEWEEEETDPNNLGWKSGWDE